MKTTPRHWHRVALTRAQYEGGEAGLILGAFIEIFFNCNGSRGMAIYGAWSDDGLRYFVYFTPRAALRARVLIDAYSGKVCEVSENQSLEFIFGDDTAAGLCHHP